MYQGCLTQLWMFVLFYSQRKNRLLLRHLALTTQVFVPNLPYVRTAPGSHASRHKSFNKSKSKKHWVVWLLKNGRQMRLFFFKLKNFSLSQEEPPTLRLCRNAQMRHNEINQKHKLGEVPRAVLITQGQFCLCSAGGNRVVKAPLSLHCQWLRRQNIAIKAATGGILRIRAWREALLICGPGGGGMQRWITAANPKVALPRCQKQGSLIKGEGLFASSYFSRNAATHCRSRERGEERRDRDD